MGGRTLRDIISLLWEYIRSCFETILRFFQRSKVISFDNGREVRIIRQIAEGGFSVVYEARDYKHHKGKRYALKRILCFDTDMIKKCREEAGVHRSFKHPNLLPLYALKFEKSDTYTICYMLFPYLPTSLRDDITSRQLLSSTPSNHNPYRPRELLEIFGGIVDGVAAMHSRGLTHRDIKVENVLFDAKRKPVLMDFGSTGPAIVPIGTRTALLSVVDAASGHTTISYRAPELFEGGTRYGDDIPDIDGRIDVWSLGCVLFAMMYGSSPFEVEFRGDGVKIVECTQLRVLGDVPRPGTESELSKRYDGRLTDFVDLMLTRDRVLRPTVEEVSKQVDELLEAFGGKRRWRRNSGAENGGDGNMFEELMGDVV